ncbi:MAG: transketolase [Variovorax sp.]
MADSILMANAIRALAMDAVQKADSGHPGAPMGMADMAVALWRDHLRHNPLDPHWIDRDRFVLSNGHASMMQYAVLHLTGYDLPMDELKHFRQLHSKTPGHPEVDLTPGIESTTGPLGQGFANAVGFALTEKLLASEFNRPGHDIVDHHTYVFMGDGCMMEGISHEAAGLAGAWKLGKLIALYDDNDISIDGHVSPWFVDDTAERFRAHRWQAIGPIDGNDAKAVSQAIDQAKRETEKPSLIVCKTIIGKGSPHRADTAKAHGEALGVDEVAATRKAIGWRWPAFEIPVDVYEAWDARASGAKEQADWNDRFDAYALEHPRLASELKRRMAGALPNNFHQIALDTVVAAHTKAENLASRKASQQALEAFTAALPEMLGGSADLTGSNFTNTTSTPALRFDAHGDVVQTTPEQPGAEDEKPGASAGGAPRRLADADAPASIGGRHINYGVREFGMAAVMNGIASHGGFIPYGGTFLTFSDYSRNAIRMAALMKRRVIHVLTHDSIGLGEDGPTHQSIEHAASLRLIPNLDVWRPGDTAETAVAWAVALQTADRPSALLLSRQSISYAPKRDLADISKGAYVLAEPGDAGFARKKAQAVLIATGSEVPLAMKARDLLAQSNIAVRVVSMPSTSVFDRQSVAYKRSVLPDGVPRIAIEMGVTDYWWKYGCAAVVGIDTFGESAPGSVVIKYFGFTPENVVAVVERVLER